MGSYGGAPDVLARIQEVVEFADAPLLNVNQRGMFGNTPLKVACVWGDIDAASFLLDAGADVNAKNEDGYTALHWAASLGNQRLASLLIERGAGRESTNDEGLTPRELARFRGDEAMALLLDPPTLA